MGLAAVFGEANLLLPLSQRRHFGVGERAVAARTGDALFEMWVRAIFSADRMAARMAELIVTHF